MGGAGSVFTNYVLRAIVRYLSKKSTAINMISSPQSPVQGDSDPLKCLQNQQAGHISFPSLAFYRPFDFFLCELSIQPSTHFSYWRVSFLLI